MSGWRVSTGKLEEVKNQLGRVWHFIARSDSVDVAEASDLIVELRERKEKLEIATEEARALLKERRQFLDSADTIAAFAAEMSEFLKTSELTETKAFVGSFVKEVVVKPGRAAIVYSIPTPEDSPIGGADAAEIALNGRVMNSVRHGGDRGTRTPNLGIANAALSQLSYIPTWPVNTIIARRRTVAARRLRGPSPSLRGSRKACGVAALGRNAFARLGTLCYTAACV